MSAILPMLFSCRPLNGVVFLSLSSAVCSWIRLWDIGHFCRVLPAGVTAAGSTGSHLYLMLCWRINMIYGELPLQLCENFFAEQARPWVFQVLLALGAKIVSVLKRDYFLSITPRSGRKGHSWMGTKQARGTKMWSCWWWFTVYIFHHVSCWKYMDNLTQSSLARKHIF